MLHQLFTRPGTQHPLCTCRHSQCPVSAAEADVETWVETWLATRTASGVFNRLDCHDFTNIFVEECNLLEEDAALETPPKNLLPELVPPSLGSAWGILYKNPAQIRSERRRLR